MEFLKAKTRTDLILKTLTAGLGLNLLVSNLLMLRDMASYSMMGYVYFIVEVFIFAISFKLGLEIKRINNDILKKNDFVGIKLASIVAPIVSILYLFLGTDLQWKLTGIAVDLLGNEVQFINRYIDHNCNAFLLISLSLVFFGVFATKVKDIEISDEELRLIRQKLAKKILMVTSPALCLFIMYSMSISYYRMTNTDFNYLNEENVAFISIEYVDNYNNELISIPYDLDYDKVEFKTNEIVDIISKYTFDCNATTFIPNTSAMSQSDTISTVGNDRMVFTVNYENGKTEYIDIIQDGRLRIHNIKDKAVYSLSDDDTTKLFDEVYGYLKNNEFATFETM